MWQSDANEVQDSGHNSCVSYGFTETDYPRACTQNATHHLSTCANTLLNSPNALRKVPKGLDLHKQSIDRHRVQSEQHMVFARSIPVWSTCIQIGLASCILQYTCKMHHDQLYW